MTSDERIGRYVDGEQDAADRAAFEAAMADDPALAQAVAAHRLLATQLRAAYDPVLDEPVPARLAVASQVANDRAPTPRFGLPQWAAMAACLVAGVLVGRAAQPEQGPLARDSAGMVARAGLERALTTQLAADAGPIRVGLSFRDGGGRYCRTFQSAPDRLAGLACRGGGAWRMEVATAWRPQAAADYRTAGSETPAPVLAAVDALRSGEVLNATAERAARDAGWR